MSPLSVCQAIQNTGLSTSIRESTWGVPIVGALHVLALAWFGGFAVAGETVATELRHWKRLGVLMLLVTGALLFWVEPVKCYESASFRVKMALLVLIAAIPRTRLGVGLSLLLWIAAVCAARGIAFF